MSFFKHATNFASTDLWHNVKITMIRIIRKGIFRADIDSKDTA